MKQVNQTKIIQILRIYNTIMKKKYYKSTRVSGTKEYYSFSSTRFHNNICDRNKQDFGRLSKILNKIEMCNDLNTNVLSQFFYTQAKLILQFYKARKTLFTTGSAFMSFTNDCLEYKQNGYSAMIKII